MPVLTLIQHEHPVKIAFTGTPVLRDLLAQTGHAISSPCGGKGTCGKCKVVLQGEISAPNAHERAAGSRLACQVILQCDATVRLSGEEDTQMQIELGTVDISTTAYIGSWQYGAVIDIGTTTVAAKLFTADGICVGEAAALNPQRAVSADVIGRIDASLHGAGEWLKAQINACIDALLANACATAGITPAAVNAKIITGNTAMLYFLTGHSPASIARAPFDSEILFDTWMGDAYLPPCMNAFVGADITCAILASGMCNSDRVSLLCDLGTNGELALWKAGRLYVTSTAAGPAFEGAEISCGCGSIAGAVDRVWVEYDELRVHTICDAPACGICGTGLIDAIAAFLELGFIDESGVVHGELILSANGETISLKAEDIRAVQLAKAAVAAGIAVILARAEVSPEEVETLYLAGGFGNHLVPERAARIGLIPHSLVRRVKPIGNAALAGAALLLFAPDRVAEAQRIAANAEYVNLGGSSDFNDAYIDHLFFPEVNLCKANHDVPEDR